MRVDFTNLGFEPPEKSKPGRAQSGTSTAAPGAGASGSAGESAGAGVDQTRFSFDQARVASLEAHALQAPEVRQEKVEPLRQSVESGEYTVDAGQVAAAMTSELSAASVR